MATKPRGASAQVQAAVHRLESQGMRRPTMRGPAYCSPISAGRVPRYVPIEQAGRHLDTQEARFELIEEDRGAQHHGRRVHGGVMCHVFSVPAMNAEVTDATADLATRRVTISLTAEQARDFARCARVAGVDLDQWIVQCAAVQAANAIDAMQATARRRRSQASEEASNKPVNVRRRLAARLRAVP